MTYEEIINYYANLLIVQYNSKEKAAATIDLITRALLPKNSYSDNLLVFDIRDSFDIDTAVGVQLDIIGKYVGVDRFYTESVFDKVYFGFSDAAQYEPPDVEGFSDASDFLTKDGEFLGASGAVATGNQLNDENFRILIKMRIRQNNSDHSNYDIDDIIYTFFGSDLQVVETYNMLLCFFLTAGYDKIIQVAFQKDVIPRPMGVGVQAILPLEETFFCFTSAAENHDVNFEGFASASDFDTKDGTFLGVSDLISL